MPLWKEERTSIARKRYKKVHLTLSAKHGARIFFENVHSTYIDRSSGSQNPAKQVATKTITKENPDHITSTLELDIMRQCRIISLTGPSPLLVPGCRRRRLLRHT